MFRQRILIAAVMSALSLTALPAAMVAQDDAGATPEGVVWNLTSAGDLAVPPDVEATLFMENGEANGSTGCNSFSGAYELDGDSLTFDENFAVTMAFCEGAPGEVELAYMAALPTVASWSIEDSELSLADDAGTVVLAFAEAPVEIVESDIVALIGELERLDQRINNTRQDMRQLNVDALRERVAANEATHDELSKLVTDQNVPGLRDRVIANEAVLDDLSERFINVRKRVRDLEERVEAIEAQLGLEINPLE